MINAKTRWSLATLCCGLLCSSAFAQGVVPPIPLKPAKRARVPAKQPTALPKPIVTDGVKSLEDPAPEPPDKPTKPTPAMADAEATRIIAIHNALDPDAQEAMREYYLTQDIDLLELITAQVGGGRPPLMPSFGRKKFKRTPQGVLSARTTLGLDSFRPAETAPPAEMVNWLHLNVMAGEWGELQWFLDQRAGDEAQAMYSHVLQSTNQGDPMLLPEEVLELANAAPESNEGTDTPTDWQIDVLGTMLKQSARRASVGPMLEQLHAGTRLFGGDAPESQARTAALLTRSKRGRTRTRRTRH